MVSLFSVLPFYYVICLQSDLAYWPTIPGTSEKLLEDRKSWLVWLANDSAGIVVTDPMALYQTHGNDYVF